MLKEENKKRYIMSLEENKAIVRRFIEELNKRNIAIMDELVAPAMGHPTLRVQGLEEYKQFETALWKAFPDWHETILDMVAEGDKVWLLAEVTATHKGEWLSFLPYINRKVRLAPTGKETKFTYVGLYRIVDGKIAERLSIHAIADFFRDIGVIEYKDLSEDAS
jgi:predicted ester cyclase